MSCALLATQFHLNVGEALLALILGFIFSFIAVQSSGHTDVNPVSTVAKVRLFSRPIFPPLMTAVLMMAGISTYLRRNRQRSPSSHRQSKVPQLGWRYSGRRCCRSICRHDRGPQDWLFAPREAKEPVHRTACRIGRRRLLDDGPVHLVHQGNAVYLVSAGIGFVFILVIVCGDDLNVRGR